MSLAVQSNYKSICLRIIAGSYDSTQEPFWSSPLKSSSIIHQQRRSHSGKDFGTSRAARHIHIPFIFVFITSTTVRYYELISIEIIPIFASTLASPSISPPEPAVSGRLMVIAGNISPTLTCLIMICIH